jgi:hypothetical protein
MRHFKHGLPLDLFREMLLYGFFVNFLELTAIFAIKKNCIPFIELGLRHRSFHELV